MHNGDVLWSRAQVLPAIGQEELWDELLDISRVVGDALPGGGDAVEHAVCHIKPADQPVGDCSVPCSHSCKAFPSLDKARTSAADSLACACMLKGSALVGAQVGGGRVVSRIRVYHQAHKGDGAGTTATAGRKA